jgi:hypothetical protein
VANFTETNRTWTILTTTGGISNFDASEWAINTGGFTSSPSWTGTWSLTQSGSNLVLNYNVVPEPGSALLGCSGVLMLLGLRRRTANKG